MTRSSKLPLAQSLAGVPLTGQSEKTPLHDTPPSAWLMTLEVRAIWEFSALLPAWPLLNRAPRGDNHPVVVFPGLSANDISTVPLRRYLQLLNYSACGWDQGFNFGPRPGVLQEARNQVIRTFARTGRKVSLIGWSLGGIYARELAKELPEMVRGVITLGTPFAGSHKATNAWRLYELASGRSVTRESASYNLPVAPPVPTTSIFSRTDGVVAWQGSIQSPSPQNPHTENIEVVASHVGLGFNPSAWWAIADRLAQPEGEWQPFLRQKRGRIHGLIYPDPSRPA
ncbi:pimeloyl-ACP methyl ester carboxylesterase [Polaromonas sp. CG_9.5]|uniref:alpha/beta hydrolase n=1 Tax=Polaromonas sp. CG_9.5 TaxID=3071705 RepID=UPI002DF9D905|nr:pimeloyl-ACP methyl ester carboxylesterase [Polaromonas sp. CG_9.5]